jgi:hypothetical protein
MVGQFKWPPFESFLDQNPWHPALIELALLWNPKILISTMSLVATSQPIVILAGTTTSMTLTPFPFCVRLAVTYVFFLTKLEAKLSVKSAGMSPMC